ncbi:MAG: hypothetical protein PHW69_07830 [Elusimicrobiaceae bacterium]|nr:hypothetical protein [Elusimicrobiaceae bacterium]
MPFFKKLFGVEKTAIRPHCIISPLNEAPLFCADKKPMRAHGDYFRVTDLGYATLIGTHYSLLVGDCVLSLSGTPCRNIYLFGCAGGLNLEIGSRVVIGRAVNFESFSDMLAGTSRAQAAAPDAELTAGLRKFAGSRTAAGVTASVASLRLEESHLKKFEELGVNCLEMEAASVFSAARHIGKKACAAVYISDRVPDKPWHEQLSHADIARLAAGRRSLADSIAGYIKSLHGRSVPPQPGK